MWFNIGPPAAHSGPRRARGNYVSHFSLCAGRQLPHKASAYREEAGAFEPGREADEASVVPHTARVQHWVWAQQQPHGQVLLTAVPSVPTRKNTLQRLRQWRDRREHGSAHTHTHKYTVHSVGLYFSYYLLFCVYADVKEDLSSRKKRGLSHRDDEGSTTETFIAQMAVFDKNRWETSISISLTQNCYEDAPYWTVCVCVRAHAPGVCSFWTVSMKYRCSR